MSIASAIRGMFGRASPPPPAVEAERRRAAARVRVERSLGSLLPGIATQDISRMTGSINEFCRAHLTRMRQQSRGLAFQNDYARQFIRLVEQNVVGPDGVRLQMRVKDPGGQLDQMANAIIEQAYNEFCKPRNCDVSGRKSMRAFQKLIVRCWARDGEVFIRKVRGFSGSKSRFALQIIPVELIYEGYWDKARNIVCGIERDTWDRPTGYWLRQDSHTETTVRGIDGNAYLRIPADEMCHLYLEEYPGQMRGLPWMHSSIIRLHQLGAFEEAEVIAARISASKMAWLTAPEGDGTALADGMDEAGRLSSSVSPGAIDVLPHGYSVEQFDPTHPNANMAAFTKAMLRGFFSGVGISYNAGANDLEGVNLSSLRDGKTTERETWRSLQRELAEQVMDSIFSDWLDMAFLSGQLDPLPAAKREKFNAPFWLHRGWSYSDPTKEVDATLAAINGGLKTYTQALAEQGVDFEELLEQRRLEQEKIKASGVVFVIGNAPPPAPVLAPAEDE